MKKKTIWIILLGLVVLLAGASGLYNLLGGGETPGGTAPGAATETDEEGSADETADKVLATDFTVYDLEGNEVHLSDFRGKPVVLNFWASWCGPCQSEMPGFDAKAAELTGQVQFLMVNVTDGSQETVESASSFIEKEGYTFPVYYDISLSAASAYGATSLPMTYFIDAEGYGIARAVGAINEATLQQGIDMITK